METLDALRTNIQLVLQDSKHFTDEILDMLINQACSHVASKVLLSRLEASGVLPIDPSIPDYIIPDAWNFDRELCNPILDGVVLKQFNSNRALQDAIPGVNDLGPGTPQYIVVTGNRLKLYPTPEVTNEILFTFHEKPTKLASDRDEPTFLPHLTNELIENFVLYKAFSMIEDGVDGRKVNTTYYIKLFNQALDALEDVESTGQSRAEIQRVSKWV